MANTNGAPVAGGEQIEGIWGQQLNNPTSIVELGKETKGDEILYFVEAGFVSYYVKDEGSGITGLAKATVSNVIDDDNRWAFSFATNTPEFFPWVRVMAVLQHAMIVMRGESNG